MSVLCVKQDAEDGTYVIRFIQIDFDLILDINPHAVGLRGYHENSLIVILYELTRLIIQRLFELIQCVQFLTFVIEFKNFVILREYDGIRITFESFFEIVKHANFIENGQIFDYHSFVQLKLVIVKLTRALHLFKYIQLVLLLLTHHQVFASKDGEPIFVLRFLNSNNFIWLTGLSGKQFDGYRATKLQGLLIVHEHFVYLGDENQIGGEDLNCLGAFKVLVIHTNSQVVHVLALINVKAPLISFVGDSISHFGSYHHLVAPHVVVHDVFERWLISLWVDQIKVNLRRSRYLDPDVSSDEVNESSDFQHIVQHPFCGFKLVTPFSFEKQNFARAPCDQSVIKNENHLAKVCFCDSLKLEILKFARLNIECLTLSIKRIN